MTVPAIPEPRGGLQLPSRIGQATAVEQSRAVAEVQAAVIVAQQAPRDVDQARAVMLRSCAHLTFAERAFYRYSRAGTQIAGASVHLARELARCWGNIQYSVDEMRRDDGYGQSEMRAWAWDLETNARSTLTFIVPHARDKSGGPKRLTDMRDIYENNANMGARRLREAIFSILPVWFTEEAQAACHETIKKGEGVPLEERITKAIALFDRLGVTVDAIASKIGRAPGSWTADDLAQLTVTYRSIERGEVTVEDEFPQRRVTLPMPSSSSTEVAPEASAAKPKS